MILEEFFDRNKLIDNLNILSEYGIYRLISNSNLVTKGMVNDEKSDRNIFCILFC